MILPWLEPLWREFTERLDSGRMAHALLLSGAEGTGKLALAVEFMASLLCLENKQPACGRCRSCQLLGSGAHPDRIILTFEPKKNSTELRNELTIDQVRRLTEFLQLTTTISPRKVTLLYPAETLNRSAANALLKTLEEPPGETVLILVAHDPARLPPTIRSRCQNLRVSPPDTITALSWLRAECGSGESDALDALEAAAGSPLRARDMLEDGRPQQYRMLKDTLRRLRAQDLSATEALDDLSEIDPESLWSWLSLHAARELRHAMTNRNLARQIAALQSLADAYRKLLSTPVRKDLLLQDWLIQWGRLPAVQGA
ncbi:MAG: DNA polymerase III subunit delta' [Xanthomonadales bacterium]|nr:DNA polymerase III subunit delta' [Xanthomonadales bacterium]